MHLGWIVCCARDIGGNSAYIDLATRFIHDRIDDQNLDRFRTANDCVETARFVDKIIRNRAVTINESIGRELSYLDEEIRYAWLRGRKGSEKKRQALDRGRVIQTLEESGKRKGIAQTSDGSFGCSF